MATNLIKGRETREENSDRDLFQFTPEIIRTCSPLTPRKNQNTEGFYYEYWMDCPGQLLVKAPPVLSLSLNPEGRREYIDPAVKYKDMDEANYAPIGGVLFRILMSWNTKPRSLNTSEGRLARHSSENHLLSEPL